jgi:hypothetical protein
MGKKNMAGKSRRDVKKHRLLVYYRLGQRLRTVPFLIALFCVILLGIGWMGSEGIFQEGNRGLIERLWTGRLLLFVAIGASVLLYLFSLYISHTSYVQARPKALRVKAGLVPVDISYGRIRQIRLVQFDMHYPPDKLKGSDAALVEPFEGATCTSVDLKSLPKPFTPQLLKRVWNKFMFTGDGESVMFVVRDPMVLNQQIDGYISARQARIKGSTKYVDPIERAAQDQAAHAARAKKKQPAAPQVNIGRKR